MDSSNESREDVLHVPNLYEYFCNRTAEDMRSRGSTADDTPATSFASLIISLLLAFALYVFGKPGLAKAMFVVFGLLVAWTVWGAVIRSSEQVSQKADDIKAGAFPPAASPYVLARLKWWNHLIVPRRWGRHSRLFDRRARLERKIEDVNGRLADAIAEAGAAAEYTPPNEEEVALLASDINSYSDRNEYEFRIASLSEPVQRLRGEMLLYMALLHKLNEMSDKLDRIEKLNVTFHNVSPDDLSQVVTEAIQLLDERRLLVLNVDTVDPENFIDLVTVRAF